MKPKLIKHLSLRKRLATHNTTIVISPSRIWTYDQPLISHFFLSLFFTSRTELQLQILNSSNPMDAHTNIKASCTFFDMIDPEWFHSKTTCMYVLIIYSSWLYYLHIYIYIIKKFFPDMLIAVIPTYWLISRMWYRTCIKISAISCTRFN